MEPDPDSQKCCICQGSCQSHFCSSCQKLCHPWCGKSSVDEEGYGCSITCSSCEDANNLKVSGSGKSIYLHIDFGYKIKRNVSQCNAICIIALPLADVSL